MVSSLLQQLNPQMARDASNKFYIDFGLITKQYTSGHVDAVSYTKLNGMRVHYTDMEVCYMGVGDVAFGQTALVGSAGLILIPASIIPEIGKDPASANSTQLNSPRGAKLFPVSTGTGNVVNAGFDMGSTFSIRSDVYRVAFTETAVQASNENQWFEVSMNQYLKFGNPTTQYMVDLQTGEMHTYRASGNTILYHESWDAENNRILQYKALQDIKVNSEAGIWMSKMPTDYQTTIAADKDGNLSIPTQNVTISVDCDKGTISIDTKDDISIKCNNATVEAQEDVSLKCNNATVEAQEDVSLKCNNATVEAQQEVSLKCDKANIEASTNATIKAKDAQITGGNLTVNGAASPSGSGPFCGIPACLYTGATHIGNKVSGT